MSGSPVASSPETADATDPSAGKLNYGFSTRVLLMAALLLVALTVVFTLIRLLLYLFVVRSAGRRRSGLAGGILRSMNSFGSRSRRGLDGPALSALPVTAYRKGSGSTGGAGADCAVCLSELADGEKVRELPNCGHAFHVDCVDAWLRNRTTCPLCRAEVELLQRNEKAEANPQSSSSSPPRASATGVVWCRRNLDHHRTWSFGYPQRRASDRVRSIRIFAFLGLRMGAWAEILGM